MIGKVIRKMRKSKKINQQKLGTMIGVAQTTMSGYETGYSNPEFSLIKNIADICNYDIIFVERDTKEEITL